MRNDLLQSAALEPYIINLVTPLALKKGDGAVDWLSINNVEVVEDEREVILDRIDFIDQGRQD